MRQRVPEGRIWAADTGCFSKPHEHDDDKYLAWLKKENHRRDACLFATAPDVYGDADATLQVALPMFDRIRGIGYKAALVCQDNLKSENVPWGLFDVFFLGGKDDWRNSEAFRELVKEAVDRGLWVHMGRVNSLKRMRYAKSLGCKSVDGTLVAFNPTKNAANLAKWLTIVNSE